MKLPQEVPVMTLPNATLFPQALLPLYIFEPRYRRMLLDSLDSDRMFSVAMQRPGHTRESPSPIAGLGLIRASVKHPDGTSHLILQGVARVELGETIRYKPYRVQRIRPLMSPTCNGSTLDTLLGRVRELLDERAELESPLPLALTPKSLPAPPTGFAPREVLKYLNQLTDPGQVADLVTCAVLSGPMERQVILETVNLEFRLKQLIRFLTAEISRRKKDAHR